MDGELDASASWEEMGPADKGMSYCRKHNVEFKTHCLTCSMEAEAASMAHPMDKEYLREMAKVVESKLPDRHGFIVFAFPFDGGRMFYLSNAVREDAIKALKEWLIQVSGEEEWMKHIK
jgi:hypothetical protein